MKRLRVEESGDEPSSQRLRESYSVVMTRMNCLSRDERESLIAEARRFSVAECHALASQIPDELWLVVFMHCDAGYSFIVFRIGSVSKQWLRVADSLIVQQYAFVKEQMPRVLRKFTHLESLSLGGPGKCEYIGDETLVYLSNLTALDLSTNKRITGEGLRTLTALRDLNLTATKHVHGKRLAHIYTRLGTLSLARNRRIRDSHLAQMTSLTSLDLSANEFVSSTSVSTLTNLSTLCLMRNYRVGDAALKCLPNLTELEIDSSLVTDAGLIHLEVKLRLLSTLETTGITGAAIARMTNLRSLTIDETTVLTDTELAQLTNLRQLLLLDCNTITDAGVRLLTNLEHLSVMNCKQVTTGVLPFLCLCESAEFDEVEMIDKDQSDSLL